jgi:2-polyprenyl-3-methyl-5-hydroxy-6-metoxy-1,4-benzoquinol methylase
MSFEDVMQAVSRWEVAVSALAALGAELSLKQSDQAAPPEIVDALRSVSTAAGLGDLGELNPQQQQIALALARLAIRQAADLLDAPGRTPGWQFTDPEILDGWGRGSTMVPTLLAAAHSDLQGVRAFLDVGTGVGLLAVAATSIWPNATVVGIDMWDPSLERARANVAHADLTERITLRKQDVTAVDDVDAFDLVWVPTFFLQEPVLAQALPALVRATRPGGWIALGRFVTPTDPLELATNALQTIRGGGFDLEAKRGVELLEQAGCASCQVVPPPGPAPLELIIGQKPA